MRMNQNDWRPSSQLIECDYSRKKRLMVEPIGIEYTVFHFVCQKNFALVNGIITVDISISTLLVWCDVYSDIIYCIYTLTPGNIVNLDLKKRKTNMHVISLFLAFYWRGDLEFAFFVFFSFFLFSPPTPIKSFSMHKKRHRKQWIEKENISEKKANEEYWFEIEKKRRITFNPVYAFKFNFS